MPFSAVLSIFAHQWHKDTARMIFAHADHFRHNYSIRVPGAQRLKWVIWSRPSRSKRHSQQLELLKGDLVWHREKYVTLYIEALLAATRLPDQDAHHSEPLTMKKELKIRKALTRKLEITLPRDLLPVSYDKVPRAMENVQDIADAPLTRPHPWMLSVPMIVTLISIHMDLQAFIPKNPVKWDWSQPPSDIEAKHEAVLLDLF